mgnify:CR=1 FL=1
MGNTNKSNSVVLVGKIAEKLTLNNEVYKEKFYSTTLLVERNSGYVDEVPIILSERLLEDDEILGKTVEIRGQFRSCNKHEGERARLVLYVFVQSFEVLGDTVEIGLENNTVSFEGYVCGEPHYRVTSTGREVCDVILAVNRSYKRADFIPCIFWSRNAKFASTWKVRTKIKLTGRVQSRKYPKMGSDKQIITKTAYEVSVSHVEVMENTTEDGK